MGWSAVVGARLSAVVVSVVMFTVIVVTMVIVAAVVGGVGCAVDFVDMAGHGWALGGRVNVGLLWIDGSVLAGHDDSGGLWYQVV